MSTSQGGLATTFKIIITLTFPISFPDFTFFLTASMDYMLHLNMHTYVHIHIHTYIFIHCNINYMKEELWLFRYFGVLTTSRLAYSEYSVII